MASRKLVGVVYNQKAPKARALAQELTSRLGGNEQAWVCSAGEVEERAQVVEATSLIFTVGGDGTILRAARVAAPLGVPIVGVNMGRVGFLTELSPEDALKRIDEYLSGKGWIEERTMLRAEVYSGGVEHGGGGGSASATFDALNDVVIGRGPTLSLIFVETYINGVPLATYAADAVITATATGSTGYNLAAGGPILDPQSSSMILKPLAAHLTLSAALVLPKDAVIKMKDQGKSPAILSVDGFQNVALSSGDVVRVKRSPYVARFLRNQTPSYFYASLIKRLSRSQQ